VTSGISCVVCAKQIILSPFTKEYRVQATPSGISQLLKLDFRASMLLVDCAEVVNLHLCFWGI